MDSDQDKTKDKALLEEKLVKYTDKHAVLHKRLLELEHQLQLVSDEYFQTDRKLRQLNEINRSLSGS